MSAKVAGYFGDSYRRRSHGKRPTKAPSAMLYILERMLWVSAGVLMVSTGSAVPQSVSELMPSR
jgi:hypothetical protein